MRNPVAYSLALALSLASPAVAAPADPGRSDSQDPYAPNALVALAASVGPLAIADLLALGLTPINSDALRAVGITGVVLAPLFEGWGQYYAGDPTRGLIISTGALVSATGGAALGVTTTQSWKGAAPFAAVIGWCLGANAYGVFAGLDAMATALRAPARPVDAGMAAPWGPFPRERSVGALFGLGGPGVAMRGYLTPEVGLQGGFNTLWQGLGTYSAGGQLIYSPVHRDGLRLYGFFGGAYAKMPDAPYLIPSLGLGASNQFGQRLTLYLDFGLLDPMPLNPVPAPLQVTAYPQVGLLFDF